MKRPVLSCLALVFFLTAGRCPPLKDVLKSYNMVELRPPGKNMGPGTLVWVSDEMPFTAGVICSSARTMGADWVPSESPTMNTELQKTAKKGINFKVDVAQIAGGTAAVDSIKEVSMSLKNAKLFEINDWDVENRQNKADQTCLRAMLRRQRAGFKVTLIASALQADVTYHVKWQTDAELSVQAKIAQLEQIAVNLGLTSSSVTDKTISADSLLWGVRADDFLAWLYSPDNIEKADYRGSILNPEWDGSILQKDDTARGAVSSDTLTADGEVEEDYWNTADARSPGR